MHNLFLSHAYSASNEDTDPDSECESTMHKAVTCTGMQEDGDAFIFGPHLHFTVEGSIIPTHQQQYVWVESIILKLQCRVNPLRGLPRAPVSIINPLGETLLRMQKVVGENFISGAFLLGK